MTELIGRALGQYRIIEQIGKGGMAAVYKSYQSGLDRYVAVKVLPPIHAEQPGFTERFRREAKAIANLHHPNILPVYDFGMEEGYSFIVMRYIEGARTLKEVMAEISLDPTQAADVIRQIAAALDHAHRQGVIHRDIKPSNVLMDGDWALLTDFGLAKMTEASVRLTGSGVGVGTPAYMSPEQGQGAKVDHRTDVYSLGIVLFEMLTGQIPHNAETPFAIVLKRVTEPLPLPRAIEPGIPEAVERVILKALAREPENRFETAGAMATALEQAVREPVPVVEEIEEEIEAAPPVERESPAAEPSEAPTPAPSPPPARRTFNWKWVTAIGIVAVAVFLCLVGLSIVSRGRDRIKKTRTAAALVATATSPAATIAPTETLKAATETATSPPATSSPTRTTAPTETPTRTLPPPTRTPRPTSTPPPAPTNTPAPAPDLSGRVVTAIGPFVGAQADRFNAVNERFTGMTGVEVAYQGDGEFQPALTARIEAGDPPDVALIPQPGLMKELAGNGMLIPLWPEIVARVEGNYAPVWKELGSYGGRLYGVFHRVSIKSLVWYPKPAFEAAGYRVPTTWEELIALSDQIVADGRTPWCIGMESGAASGWVATDWVEDILLRTAGPQVYDQWVSHEIPFTDPRIGEAVAIMDRIWFDPRYVLGGRDGILTTSFGDAPAPMFQDPPRCWLHRQGSFVVSFFPEEVRENLDREVGVFSLPPIDPQWGTPVLGAGDLIVMFDDRPEVRAYMAFLTTPDSIEPWARAGGAVFPHQDQDLSWYPTQIERAQAEMLLQASIFRFDASDSMPAQVGTRSFWQGMVDYVSGADLDTVLARIEASWP